MILFCYSMQVIRYSHYALSCIGSPPYLITYLRYTAFILLYPVGVGPGEIWLMYQALPFIKTRNLYADTLPFSYYNFVKKCNLHCPVNVASRSAFLADIGVHHSYE
ncbi:hypothetical protein H5410_058771 [Solanum commersonii]|uniref:Very-long-chain (3R)-3-hydroxyacyl-CoA dehydratase n=1 Tax=Solanum commersonii TaxID=4109 RepID=A0A9J5WTN9_SOLCO|nr:hypothetical protein H5410_058771 [Solanum commersonii]